MQTNLKQENKPISGNVFGDDVDARTNATLAHEIILLDGEIRMMIRLDPWRRLIQKHAPRILFHLKRKSLNIFGNRSIRKEVSQWHTNSTGALWLENMKSAHMMRSHERRFK